MTRLTEANRAALAHVRARAERDRPLHSERIARVAGRDAAAVVDAVRRAAMLTLNFHPDRLLADGRTVAEALHDEGTYRSQFETGISSGGLTAYPGGDRDRWERALFGGAYQAPGVRDAERPRYGGLNVANYRNGACPRFGSCHLRLRRAALDRATFVFGDSTAEPTDVAVIDVLEPVIAPLLERIAAEGGVLGREGVGVPELIGGLAPAMARTLDDYVEAQVHGPVALGEDVEAVVIDPAFAGTPTGDSLTAAAERRGFACEWHTGMQLALSAVPDDGPQDGPRWRAFCADGRARRLAEHVAAGEPRLDAATIGAAAASVVRSPERWQQWGAPADVLQQLKYLWLILVAHGDAPG